MIVVVVAVCCVDLTVFEFHFGSEGPKVNLCTNRARRLCVDPGSGQRVHTLLRLSFNFPKSQHERCRYWTLDLPYQGLTQRSWLPKPQQSSLSRVYTAGAQKAELPGSQEPESFGPQN